jgi:hypothetical protein
MNVKEGKPQTKAGNEKQSVTFASIKLLGECKGIKQQKIICGAQDQLLSCLQQQVLTDSD